MRSRAHSLAFVIALGTTTALAAVLMGTIAIDQTVASGSLEKSGAAATQPGPKTPRGGPYLQGTWSNTTVVPFERPREFGKREIMTDAEYKKAQDDLLRRDALPGRDSREINGKDIRGTEKDVARAYNEHWFGDKPTEVGRRTSMITDPPDGRMPALTPEAEDRINKKREYLAALLQGTSGGRTAAASNVVC